MKSEGEDDGNDYFNVWFSAFHDSDCGSLARSLEQTSASACTAASPAISLPSDGLFEFAFVLNAIHQVAAVDELHDEIQAILNARGLRWRAHDEANEPAYHRLKAGVQLYEKLWFIIEH